MFFEFLKAFGTKRNVDTNVLLGQFSYVTRSVSCGVRLKCKESHAFVRGVLRMTWSYILKFCSII